MVKRWVQSALKPRFTRTQKKQYRARKFRSTVPASMILPSGIKSFGGFPYSAGPVKLKYVSYQELTPGAGAPAGWVYRANSVYDPDLTGVGSQPVGRDIWASIYNNYVVVGAKITAQFNTKGTTTPFVTYGITVDDDGTFGANTTSDLMARGNSVYSIGNENYAISRPHKLVAKFSAKKWFRLKNPMDSFADIGASSGNNPSNPVCFIVWAGPTDDTADLGTIAVAIQIEYAVIWQKPIDMTLS